MSPNLVVVTLIIAYFKIIQVLLNLTQVPDYLYLLFLSGYPFKYFLG